MYKMASFSTTTTTALEDQKKVALILKGQQDQQIASLRQEIQKLEALPTITRRAHLARLKRLYQMLEATEMARANLETELRRLGLGELRSSSRGATPEGLTMVRRPLKSHESYRPFHKDSSDVLPLKAAVANRIPQFPPLNQAAINGIVKSLISYKGYGWNWNDPDIYKAIEGNEAAKPVLEALQDIHLVGIMGHGGLGFDQSVALELTETGKASGMGGSKRRSQQMDRIDISVGIKEGTTSPFAHVPRGTFLLKTVPTGMCSIARVGLDAETTLSLSLRGQQTLREIFSKDRAVTLTSVLSPHEARWASQHVSGGSENIHGMVDTGQHGHVLRPRIAVPGSPFVSKEIDFFETASGYFHFGVFDVTRIWNKAIELEKISAVVDDQTNKIGSSKAEFKQWFVLKCLYNVVKSQVTGEPRIWQKKRAAKPASQSSRQAKAQWANSMLAPAVAIPGQYAWDPLLHRRRPTDGVEESVRGFILSPPGNKEPGKLTLSALMDWKSDSFRPSISSQRGPPPSMWLDNICAPMSLEFWLPGRSTAISIGSADSYQGGTPSTEEEQLISAIIGKYQEALRMVDRVQRQDMENLLVSLGRADASSVVRRVPERLLQSEGWRQNQLYRPAATLLEGADQEGSTSGTLPGTMNVQLALGPLGEGDEDDDVSMDSGKAQPSQGGARYKRRKRATRRRRRGKNTRRRRRRRRKKTRGARK